MKKASNLVLLANLFVCSNIFGQKPHSIIGSYKDCHISYKDYHIFYRRVYDKLTLFSDSTYQLFLTGHEFRYIDGFWYVVNDTLILKDYYTRKYVIRHKELHKVRGPGSELATPYCAFKRYARKPKKMWTPKN